MLLTPICDILQSDDTIAAVIAYVHQAAGPTLYMIAEVLRAGLPICVPALVEMHYQFGLADEQHRANVERMYRAGLNALIAVFLRKMHTDCLTNKELDYSMCIIRRNSIASGKSVGRPIDFYELLPASERIANILALAYPKQVERCYPGQGDQEVIAELTPAMFTGELNYSQQDAEQTTQEIENTLADPTQDELAQQRAVRRLDAERRALERKLKTSTYKTPLAKGWTFDNTAVFIACRWRGLEETAPDESRSRTAIARFLGVSVSALRNYKTLAAVKPIPQTQIKVVETPKQVYACARELKAQAIGIVHLNPDGSEKGRDNVKNVHEAAAVVEKMGKVGIKYQLPNRYELASDTQPERKHRVAKPITEEKPTQTTTRAPKSDAQPVKIRKGYTGSGHSARWVEAQLKLRMRRCGYREAEGHIYDKYGELIVDCPFDELALQDVIRVARGHRLIEIPTEQPQIEAKPESKGENMAWIQPDEYAEYYGDPDEMDLDVESKPIEVPLDAATQKQADEWPTSPCALSPYRLSGRIC